MTALLPLSEAFLWWLAAGAVTLLVFLLYLARFQRRARRHREAKTEASRLGIDVPAAQYPWVDPAHCIGCGACVAACPEGDVLGVVGGTAVVINGLRCVGHGRCEVACPVGAITVGLGDLGGRDDVPALDEGYESTVPGLFVVGELGGLSLVRNAVAQGREVVLEIAGRGRENFGSERTDLLDLVVVGAGPAGLAAGLTAAHAGLSYRVLERETSLGGSLLHYPRRKMVLTQPVELPPWGALDREEYAKEALLEHLESLVAAAGLAIDFDAEVIRAQPVAGAAAAERHFEVETRSGTLYRARHVVLAQGRRGTPRKLGIPGEELPKVMYRLIDAASYRDRRILVVGGGDSAIEAAVGLGRQPGNRVTLSYRREKIVRVKRKNQEALERAVGAGEIEPLYSSEPVEITPDEVRLRVGGDEVTLGNDEVFVFAGGVPPFELLRGVGARFGGG